MAKKAIPLDQLPLFSKSFAEEFDPEQFKTGTVYLLDKPLEWSSFDVVKFVRNRIKVKKTGHAGTLDPLATGLLVLCSGKATKSISQVQDQPKEYLAEITFGKSTPSYDAALEPDEEAGWQHITEQMISEVLASEFSGVIAQKPPIYSAIKMKGERLYKKARRGEEVEIEPRNVEILETEILEYIAPILKLRVKCGKGTYIRSLAHDLGLALNSRAFMSALRRTAIGGFHVDNAVTPEQFDQILKENHG